MVQLDADAMSVMDISFWEVGHEQAMAHAWTVMLEYCGPGDKGQDQCFGNRHIGTVGLYGLRHRMLLFT